MDEHLHLNAEQFNCWASAMLPAATATPVLSSMLHLSDSACTTLLHPSHAQGRDIPLDEFCTEFDLGNNIHAKFTKNAYKEAQFLHFVMISKLKEMGFQLGKIAALCDAIKWWSVPHV
ncbi:hypothetical protein EDB19DRAFT_1834041 [Suillus lakei]|nr:hypothetical protein EDB19DRAFT_1834041 [Suillus lakei]